MKRLKLGTTLGAGVFNKDGFELAIEFPNCVPVFNLRPLDGVVSFRIEQDGADLEGYLQAWSEFMSAMAKVDEVKETVGEADALELSVKAHSEFIRYSKSHAGDLVIILRNVVIRFSGLVSGDGRGVESTQENIEALAGWWEIPFALVTACLGAARESEGNSTSSSDGNATPIEAPAGEPTSQPAESVA